MSSNLLGCPEVNTGRQLTFMGIECQSCTSIMDKIIYSEINYSEQYMWPKNDTRAIRPAGPKVVRLARTNIRRNH